MKKWIQQVVLTYFPFDAGTLKLIFSGIEDEL